MAMTHEGLPSILERISAPQQVQSLSVPEMEQLAAELRREIISTVSATGGHLAPSLGTVELTLALLHTFDPGKNRILWDVGHQTYAYKILTRGRERFRTLRQLGGISGFPRATESRTTISSPDTPGTPSPRPWGWPWPGIFPGRRKRSTFSP